MFPGIETLLGSLLGGVFRFGQAWLEAREKERERSHELSMLRLNGELAERADERRFRELTLAAETAMSQADTVAMVAVNAQQAEMAESSGGVVAFLSGSIRPITTYLLLGLYLAHKASVIRSAWLEGGVWTAMRSSYGEADLALLSGILGFWFVDRSLRKTGLIGGRTA